MNKCFYFLFGMIFSNINIYWDLGVAISNYTAPESQINNTLELSTYHRLEGLKKYYLDDFKHALLHFEMLNSAHKQLVLYEYINCYYELGDYTTALSLFDMYSFTDFSDNLFYLKSKNFIMLNQPKEALLVLNQLKDNFPVSDYIEIIKFDLEKINLLK